MENIESGCKMVESVKKDSNYFEFVLRFISGYPETVRNEKRVWNAVKLPVTQRRKK